MCGQFADMTEHVTGINTYQILVDLGLGRRPPPIRRLAQTVAASFPLRRFGDGIVAKVPSDARIAAVQRRLPATLIAIYYNQGDRLSDRGKHFDGASYRYACVNLAVSRREQLDPLMRQVARQLDIRITPF